MKQIKFILITAIGFFVLFGCNSKGETSVKYDNGLTVVLMHDKDSLTASINVFVRTGSIDEKPAQAGLSHFLEHLMFKGSKNYPDDLFSRNVENMGGYINAATSKEYTVYYVNIQKDGVEETVKMLADTIANPTFPQAEIDKERKVVIEEIQRHLDNPASVLFETFFETVYTKSAMRNSIIGYANIIANVTRDEIYNYYATHYVPENIVVVVAGNFDKNKVSDLISDTFGKFAKKEVPAEPLIIEEPHRGKDIIKRDRVEVSYMASGFLGPDIKSNDIFVADIASAILGGSKSSRLYRVLKEEKQLVYSIDSSFYTAKGTGIMYIMSVFASRNLDAIKAEIQAQIEEIIKNGITQEELDRAKVSLKTEWNFSLETPSEIAQNVGYWSLMKRPEIPEIYVNIIEQITVKDVQEFFIKYYTKENFSNIALVPANEGV